MRASLSMFKPESKDDSTDNKCNIIRVRLREFVSLNSIDSRIQKQGKWIFDTPYPLRSTFEVDIQVPKQHTEAIINELKEDDRIVAINNKIIPKGYNIALSNEGECARYGILY